jgi:hypothetical protein
MGFVSNSLDATALPPTPLWLLVTLTGVTLFCLLHSVYLHRWRVFPARVVSNIAALAGLLACVCETFALSDSSDMDRVLLRNLCSHGLCLFVVVGSDMYLSYERWYFSL